MAKTSIHIDVVVDGEAQEITITDDAGNKRQVKGVIVAGAELLTQAFYLFAYGSSDECGYALGRAYRDAFAEAEDTDEIIAPYYRNIFRAQARWIATYYGWDREGMKTITPEAIFEKWDKEDKIRAAIEQGERLNRDKKRDN